LVKNPLKDREGLRPLNWLLFHLFAAVSGFEAAAFWILALCFSRLLITDPEGG
jgi:hypothetical protein